MVGLDIEAFGGKVKARLTEIGEGLDDFRPLGRLIDPIYYDWIEDRMTSEGGGEWAQLSPRYAAQKAKTHPGVSILRREGKLDESLVTEGAEGNVRRVDRNGGEWGTSIPYAVHHQYGAPAGNLPRRSMIVIDNELRDGIREAMGSYLRAVIRGR